MPVISFKARLSTPDPSAKIKSDSIITLAKEASAQLPSRGTVMVKGTINNRRFQVAIEPDGQANHWFGIKKATRENIGVTVGDTLTIEVEPTKTWPEPTVPVDLQQTLAADAEAQARWLNITPMARWEWIRWLETVKLAETRKVRPAKLCSMLKSGKRRPCCFNRAIFTPPRNIDLL